MTTFSVRRRKEMRDEGGGRWEGGHRHKAEKIGIIGT
jgi:hypothetical protein